MFFVVHSWNSLWAVTRCGRLLLHTCPVKWPSETRWRWGAPTQTSHCFSISSDLVVLVPSARPRFYFSVDSQIYSRNSDGEPFGWWLAQIRMMLGEVRLSLMQTKKKIFHCTRQYLKSCPSYAFPSGVWLNTRLEARSLSCPSPSGPLIRTDCALWKHSCGATAQKNETSGCRLVLRIHTSHGCGNMLLSVTSDPSVPLLDHVGAGEGGPGLSGWRWWRRPSASCRGWCWTGEDPRYRKQKLVTQLSEQRGPQQPAIWLWWEGKNKWKKKKLHEQSKRWWGWGWCCWWWWCFCTGEHAEANGVCTEESWLSEGGRQDWVLKCECPKWMWVTGRNSSEH